MFNRFMPETLGRFVGGLKEEVINQSNKYDFNSTKGLFTCFAPSTFQMNDIKMRIKRSLENVCV